RPLQDRRGDSGGRREERRLRPLRRRAFRQERQRREPDAARHDDPPSQLRLAEDLAVPSKYSASPRVLMGNQAVLPMIGWSGRSPAMRRLALILALSPVLLFPAVAQD